MQLNRTAFLKRFYGYQALLKMREVSTFFNNETLFPPAFKSQMEAECSGEVPTWDQFENAIVKNYHCSGGAPICLYDFTLRFLIVDEVVFRCNNIKPMIIKDYFYGDETLSHPIDATQIPIYRTTHICN